MLFQDYIVQRAAKMFSKADYFILQKPVFISGVFPRSGAGITLLPGVYSNFKWHPFNEDNLL